MNIYIYIYVHSGKVFAKAFHTAVPITEKMRSSTGLL